MDYHLILNPAAGRSSAGRREAQILTALQQLPGPLQVHHTATAGEVREVAQRLSSSSTAVVIAAGGDGTVHDVVNGMVNGTAPLGIIPVGSGNDFVKMLNLPLDIQAAAAVIVRGKSMSVDIGQINQDYFSNALGIGFDAQVVIESNRIHYLRGFLIYLMAVLKTLRRYRNYRVKIRLDQQDPEEREVFMISVGNGACQGGGFFLTPEAQIDDGYLDICIFDAMKPLRVLQNLLKVMRGTHIHLPQVHCCRVQSLLVEAPEGIPVHADGELLSAAMPRLEIFLHAGKLNVFHNLSGKG